MRKVRLEIRRRIQIDLSQSIKDFFFLPGGPRVGLGTLSTGAAPAEGRSPQAGRVSATTVSDSSPRLTAKNERDSRSQKQATGV
jgi:hypothetical protein